MNGFIKLFPEIIVLLLKSRVKSGLDFVSKQYKYYDLNNLLYELPVTKSSHK